MSSIVVLGSNSFSGASFVRLLLKMGHKVVGISRSEEPNPVFLPYKWGNYSNFSFYKFDLNNDLNRIVELIQDLKPGYIVNFSAQSMVAESWENPSHWYKTNVLATINFHDQIRKFQYLKKYIHISTPEVYGNCEGLVTEECRFNPSTPYAVSRAAADMSLKSFFDAYKFPVVITRAANVYGPGQRLYRIIPRAILFILQGKKIQLHGGGSSIRSFVHIDDVSRATYEIMLRGRAGQTYHISTANQISIRDLVGEICEKLDVKFEEVVEVVGERLGKDMSYQLDSSKIRNELLWSDLITQDRGLDECISWVKNNIDTLVNEDFEYRHKP